MQRLIEGSQEILALLKRYSLAAETLRQVLSEMECFRVTVPVIGSFNTGKSAMLNALLGMRLLPVGIGATTTIPTELTYGENGVTVRREDCTQQAGLGEFCSRQLDLQGVCLLRISCDNPFLQKIESIKLVDLPGLDSNLSRPEQAMRKYLPNSLAYLLVFPADEPVVKQSVASFLSELRLHEMPVFVALTKCDKVTSDELDQAAAFLKQSMARLFGLSDFEICRTGADIGAGEVSDVLMRLQKRAGEIARDRLVSQLRAACLSLQAYLSLREGVARMPVSELESRSRMLDGRMAQLRSLLRQEESHFSTQVTLAGEEQRRRLHRSLEEAAGPMVNMFLFGQNPGAFLDGLLSSAVAATVGNAFEPAAHRCLKSVLGLMRVQGVSQESDSTAPACGALQQMGSKRRLAADPAEYPLDKTQSLFEDFCGSPAPSARNAAGRREALREQVEQEILPQLFSMADRCVDAVLQQGIERVHEAVETAVAEEYRTLQKALGDGLAAQRSADSLRRADLVQLTADLSSVRRILGLCDGTAFDPQEGGDFHGGDPLENRCAAATV